jgi:hypothetical protein
MCFDENFNTETCMWARKKKAVTAHFACDVTLMMVRLIQVPGPGSTGEEGKQWTKLVFIPVANWRAQSRRILPFLL